MPEEFDIEELSESFADILAREWPRERALAHAAAGTALAEPLWATMADLGWMALTVPAADGGLGLGGAAAARLHAALGAAVAPVPMLGTTLAAVLLGHAGAGAAARWLPQLATGACRPAVAAHGGTVSLAGGAANGTVPNILDAPAANILFLRGEADGRICWIAVATDAPGVRVEAHPLADTSRSLGTVTLANVAFTDAATIVPEDPQALDDALLRHACVALAADSLGAGEAVLAATIDYLKVREQFGAAIGSFQALKHRVADHQAALVGARALTEHAAGLAQDDPEAMLLTLSAKQHVTRTVAEIARDCIQLFGGVGFTAEYVPHLYLKRAKLNEALYGTRIALLDRIADLLEAA